MKISYKTIIPILALTSSLSFSDQKILKSDINNNGILEEIIINKENDILNINIFEDKNLLYHVKEDIANIPLASKVINYNNQQFFIYILTDGGNSGQAGITEVYFENNKLKEYKKPICCYPKIKEDSLVLKTLIKTSKFHNRGEYKEIKLKLPLSKQKP